MMNVNTGSWVFWAALSAIFAALTAVFAKVGVGEIDADVATFVRTIVILVVVFAILLFSGQVGEVGRLNSRSVLFLILSGLATGGSWLCYFRAMKLGDAARVQPIDKLSVVLVAVIGVVFLGERLSTTNWIGVAFIAAGAILVGLR